MKRAYFSFKITTEATPKNMKRLGVKCESDFWDALGENVVKEYLVVEIPDNLSKEETKAFVKKALDKEGAKKKNSHLHQDSLNTYRYGGCAEIYDICEVNPFYSKQNDSGFYTPYNLTDDNTDEVLPTLIYPNTKFLRNVDIRELYVRWNGILTYNDRLIKSVF